MNQQIRDKLINAANDVVGLPIVFREIVTGANFFHVEIVCPKGEHIDIGSIVEYKGKPSQGRNFNTTLGKIIRHAGY